MLRMRWSGVMSIFLEVVERELWCVTELWICSMALMSSRTGRGHREFLPDKSGCLLFSQGLG